MKIAELKVSVRELTSGFHDDGESGVWGYGSLLNIRPAYQRDFVYGEKQRDKVIDTLRKGYPLNVMYWVKNPSVIDAKGSFIEQFEVLDGQQRTISICKYVSGQFSINEMYFESLPLDQQEQILDYELSVYICEGSSDSEKLAWFETINIAGATLTKQELRNAVYTGEWLTDAKKRFSRSNCEAYKLASSYVNVNVSRQELLELALKWNRHGSAIRQYMADHKKDKNALELWSDFSNIINWAKTNFPKTRKELRFVNWGDLYYKYGKNPLDPYALEEKIVSLLEDDEVENKTGIYEYLLSGDTKHLELRLFGDKVKSQVYALQKGLCASPSCEQKGHVFRLDEMEADHIDPWHSGGRTIRENCQMLCKPCNRRKGGR